MVAKPRVVARQPHGRDLVKEAITVVSGPGVNFHLSRREAIFVIVGGGTGPS